MSLNTEERVLPVWKGEETAPLVSVVVVTYNREDFLRLTLNSILAQTHRNLQVVVVSDGGTAPTESTIAALNDPRVEFHRTPHAGRPAIPRNFGIARSR